MSWTIDELMACVIARELEDDQLGFVGVGTAGRAFTLAVGIPVAASRLAQLMHAPGFTIYWGNLLSPDLTQIPRTWHQDAFTRWRGASAPPDTGFKLDMLTRGDFDVCFDSAPQIDRYGNLNITAIGDDPKHPQVRLVGCLAQPEHLAFVRKPIVVTDMGPRTFVERVDHITSVGHRTPEGPRSDLGLPGPGPQLVVTDKAVLDFAGPDHAMRLRSLHPGMALDEVLGAMGFRPEVPDRLPETAPPGADELRHLRESVDPHHLLLPAPPETRP